ncbi:hypothetical protein J2Z83_003656 [Virgibacillus natechei]|uniref:Uncharacterized protein n=1 Tax=Virgibacillus natechei TaxID=1216297 RepID=A0ABS4IKS9_9BACI|nr:hypothetical protein [Virgibacillus natechei]MBP1971505.1 hypothetical protein [Virgibacillus natechei]UZD12552.1 hypothetical protein OLD84_16875 [Virgibacillus natechei]
MLISTMTLGWIGVLLFLTIIFTVQKMMKNNEFAFIHILMALMYAMWLPLPLALNQLLNSEILQVGTIFGFVYLIMLVITMALQTGHITYLVKHNDDKSITDEQGNYMMATLSNPFESLLGVFKCIWAIFLGITFWNSGEMVMAGLMFLFSLLLFYYLVILLDKSLVKRIKLFSKVKPNPYIINLETLFFFIILMSYISFNA